MARMVEKIGPRLLPWMSYSSVDHDLILPLMLIALSLMLCLFQWFALSNFRRPRLPLLPLAGQLTVILVSVGLIALHFFFAVQ